MLTTLMLLAACGGLNDETTLTELRVVAMVAEPPEVGPGQSTTITSLVVDPDAAGAETLTWVCTNLGDGCLEPTLGLTWYAAGAPGEDGTFAATFTAPTLGAPPGGFPSRPAPRAARAEEGWFSGMLGALGNVFGWGGTYSDAPWATMLDTGVPVDTGTTDTGTVDTGATDTGAVDTGAVDTGAVDTGAVDTGAVDTSDTGAVDTGAVDTSDTGAVETGDTGTLDTSDTGAIDTSDTGTLDTSDTGASDTSDTGALDTGDTGTTDTGDTGAVDTGGIDTGNLPAAAPLTGVYTLACVPGVCDVMTKAREGTLTPQDLADPFALMKGLPIEGTSLATRRLWLGSGLAGHTNPTLTLLEEPVPGDTVELRFQVAGTFGEEPLAFGFALAGGFDATRYRIEGNEVSLTWVAPEGGGSGEVIVVVNDGLGGSVVWRGVVGMD